MRWERKSEVKWSGFKIIALLSVMISILAFAGCGRQASDKTVPKETDTAAVKSTQYGSEQVTEAAEENTGMRMFINGNRVSISWEENESVDFLRELAADGIEITMSMYGGFEQVGQIGKDIPANDEEITTEPGDIVLYSGNQLVVFYGSNSWAYTKLGHITDKTEEELEQLLGQEDVTIQISMEDSE